MKKLLFVLTVFAMLAVITPAYAGDIDGLWSISLPNGTFISFVMARENAGVLLIVGLEPTVDSWQAFWGPFDGTTSNLTTLLDLNASLAFTLNLTSPNSGSLIMTSCAPISPSYQCPPIPFAFNAVKLF